MLEISIWNEQKSIIIPFRTVLSHKNSKLLKYNRNYEIKCKTENMNIKIYEGNGAFNIKLWNFYDIWLFLYFEN